MIGALALSAAVLPWPATAQGVPIVDPKSIIQHGLEIAQMSYLTGGRELEADKKRRIDELHQDQLDALDATLAMMTGQTPWIGDLEVIPGAEAEVLYAVEDNNPYAARLFGDAKTSIEEMIVATAQKYAGHPGLARAGLNPVEFRIWFQSLVKQESGFSIGARSPVGAFGLTQVMPDTAKDLGIYTAAFLSAAAETSSVKASESLERVHELVQEIPDTEGLKEAIDLNTRVTAELSIALANIWNMESAQLMGMGEAGVMDAATAAEEQKFIKVLGGE